MSNVVALEIIDRTGRNLSAEVTAGESATVVDIIERQPHASGNAKCLQCGTEWVAVAPLGVTQLQCPSCELDKGVFCGTANRGGLHYQCSCGCMHMFLHTDGVYCANCGEWAEQ